MTKIDVLANEELANKVVEDQDLKLDIAHNMKTYGGSFVQALAQCLITADRDNLRKIALTFANYLREYQPERWAK